MRSNLQDSHSSVTTKFTTISLLFLNNNYNFQTDFTPIFGGDFRLTFSWIVQECHQIHDIYAPFQLPRQIVKLFQAWNFPKWNSQLFLSKFPILLGILWNILKDVEHLICYFTNNNVTFLKYYCHTILEKVLSRRHSHSYFGWEPSV